MSEIVNVHVMCFANGGENFDSNSSNTYVLDSSEKYTIFKKYFQMLLRDNYRTGKRSEEMVRVRVVLYAAGTAGTDDWQVSTYQMPKEDFKQMERNITLGLLELGSFSAAEMGLIAIGKRPATRVDRKLNTPETEEDSPSKDSPSKDSRGNGRKLW